MLKVTIDNLDYGPYLDVTVTAPVKGLKSGLGEHPLARLWAASVQAWRRDDLAEADFEFEGDEVSAGVIVADNYVTRSILVGMVDPNLETGNSHEPDYISTLIKALFDLWD